MKRYEDNFTITLLIFLLALACIMGACLLRLADIKRIMQDQFDYQTEMQMCMQDALEYLAPCHLERDDDGSYHWYFNPNEGRM